MKREFFDDANFGFITGRTYTGKKCVTIVDSRRLSKLLQSVTDNIRKINNTLRTMDYAKRGYRLRE